MGFTLSLQRADPSPVRAAERFEADHVAMVDLWPRSEAATFDHRVPRDHRIPPLAGWCVGCRTELAQWCDGAFGGSNRGRMDRSLVESGAARMLSPSPATRIFVALEPVDLRQSFNGLSARVQSVLTQDLCSGHLFLFTNRNHNRIKVVFFDGSGLWVCAKRPRVGHVWLAARGGPRHLFASRRADPAAERSGSYAATELVPPIVSPASTSFFFLQPSYIFLWTPKFSFAILRPCPRKQRSCKVER